MLVIGTVAGLGCNTSGRLETGYRYRVLGSSEDERRAYYADKYSLEARRAEQLGDAEAEQRRQSAIRGR